MNRWLLAIALAVLASLGMRAAESPAAESPTADLGMQAPPLRVGRWVQGGPVDLASGLGKRVYVVEFWATWSTQSLAVVPHLTAIQERFRDRGVVVAGISSEPAATVTAFVQRLGARMDYAVGVDENGATGAAYLKAFGLTGVPHAFVIDQQGRIAWHGHPLAGLELVVEDVLEDRHDIPAARRAMAAGRLMREYFQKAVVGDEVSVLTPLGERVLEAGGQDPAILNEFAWTILTEVRVKTRDLEMALRAARLANERSEGKDPAILDTYARALFDTGKRQEALDLQRRAVALCKDEELRKELEKNLKTYRDALGR